MLITEVHLNFIGALQGNIMAWLCYCTFVNLTSPSETEDTFELALSYARHSRTRAILWTQYAMLPPVPYNHLDICCIFQNSL